MIDAPPSPPGDVSDPRRRPLPVSDPSRLWRNAENPPSRIGLFDTARRLFKLARPAGAWIPLLLPLLGYGWAHWERALPLWRPEAVPWLVLAWLLLHVGTLWLNAARDKDQGEVLFGEAVSVPTVTARAGAVALLASILAAVGAGWPTALVTATCALLAVLYSHPATAWKGHPVLGPLVNVVGYGVLSPVAGFLVVGAPPTTRGMLVLGLLAVAILGATFAAQAFQEEEDTARGDRTLVALRGPVVTLRVARLCFAVATGGSLVLAAVGWLPLGLLLAAPAALAMDVHLAAWSRRADGGTERSARRLAWLGLLFAAACAGGATVSYTADSIAGRPVAGLGTRAGHPGDRLLLPASHQRPLDQRDRHDTGRAYRPR